MPPKARITKEMILNTVLCITRAEGFENVNARSIAHALQCSTRPVFTCYKNMEELKGEFLSFAYEYYEQYVHDYQQNVDIRPYLLLPLSYIEFARKETFLFRLLFVKDMDLQMTEAKDFYREPGNEKKAAAFAESIGIRPEQAKRIFLDLFLYAHGIAVLAAAKKFAADSAQTEKMVSNLLAALIRQEKPGWEMEEL